MITCKQKKFNSCVQETRRNNYLKKYKSLPIFYNLKRGIVQRLLYCWTAFRNKYWHNAVQPYEVLVILVFPYSDSLKVTLQTCKNFSPEIIKLCNP